MTRCDIPHHFAALRISRLYVNINNTKAFVFVFRNEIRRHVSDGILDILFHPSGLSEYRLLRKIFIPVFYAQMFESTKCHIDVHVKTISHLKEFGNMRGKRVPMHVASPG
jgi:hypothetical protein